MSVKGIETMKPVIIKNIKIGEGKPTVCVPIVEADEEAVLEACRRIKETDAEMIEWRADQFAGYRNEEEVLAVLAKLREAYPEKPLLFTMRSDKEGGQAVLDDYQYLTLNQAVIRSGNADLVDVELSRGEEIAKQLLKNAHLHSLHVILSAHCFDETPEDAIMIETVRKMNELGADICKLAVMPKDKEDVVRLLLITEQLSRDFQDVPIVTMSMSGLGLISRISGEVSGSAITFGSLGKPSAPGQIELQELQDLLAKVHEGMLEAEG